MKTGPAISSRFGDSGHLLGIFLALETSGRKRAGNTSGAVDEDW